MDEEERRVGLIDYIGTIDHGVLALRRDWRKLVQEVDDNDAFAIIVQQLAKRTTTVEYAEQIIAIAVRLIMVTENHECDAIPRET